MCSSKYIIYPIITICEFSSKDKVMEVTDKIIGYEGNKKAQKFANIIKSEKEEELGANLPHGIMF